jgi:hypothetical protein
MSDTQYGLPLIVENLKESAARGLKRVRLEKGSSDDMYKEPWLQKLVTRYPNLLSIEQIEPALADVVPICMELPLPSGYVDTLYAIQTATLSLGKPNYSETQKRAKR